MNVVLPTPMTVDEFLRWSARQERGRYELEGGRVIEMPGESGGHVRVKHLVRDALAAAVASAGLPLYCWQNGLSVRIEPGRTFEPDAFVAPLPYPDDEALEVENPVIVVEVLSPSTMQRDLTTKVAGYALVATIEHYIVIDRWEWSVLHFRRSGQVLLPPLDPLRPGANLRLDPPGLVVPVAELTGPVPTG